MAYLNSFAKEVEVYSSYIILLSLNFLRCVSSSRHSYGLYYTKRLIKLIETQKIKKLTLIDDEEILQYIYQLANVIFYLHSKCIIHRDLKPANIMINKK